MILKRKKMTKHHIQKFYVEIQFLRRKYSKSTIIFTSLHLLHFFLIFYFFAFEFFSSFSIFLYLSVIMNYDDYLKYLAIGTCAISGALSFAIVRLVQDRVTPPPQPKKILTKSDLEDNFFQRHGHFYNYADIVTCAKNRDRNQYFSCIMDENGNQFVTDYYVEDKNLRDATLKKFMARKRALSGN